VEGNIKLAFEGKEFEDVGWTHVAKSGVNMVMIIQK
jgi:hypothetical protein